MESFERRQERSSPSHHEGSPSSYRGGCPASHHEGSSPGHHEPSSAEDHGGSPNRRHFAGYRNRLSNAIDRSTVGVRLVIRSAFVESTPGRPKTIEQEATQTERTSSASHRLPLWHFWPWMEMAIHEVENRLRPLRSEERKARKAENYSSRGKSSMAT